MFFANNNINYKIFKHLQLMAILPDNIMWEVIS